MKKLTAKETLRYVTEKLLDSLIELQNCTEQNDFIYGEKTAYVECLEWIQRCRQAKGNGLDYEVEKRFPL